VLGILTVGLHTVIGAVFRFIEEKINLLDIQQGKVLTLVLVVRSRLTNDNRGLGE